MNGAVSSVVRRISSARLHYLPHGPYKLTVGVVGYSVLPLFHPAHFPFLLLPFLVASSSHTPFFFLLFFAALYICGVGHDE
ncbi:hypothetical protein BDV32DRAFT_117098 [Aspergillus pseudonomiae]|nr:hypothetical protein BDV32DRAFT_117098 [Aspergillus pseudonomiae]